MERDCIIAHGGAKYLLERLLNTSDAYVTRVCDKCGLFAQRMFTESQIILPEDQFYCKGCRNYTHITKIRLPYSMKLLIQELMAMNIAPRIRTTQYSV